MELINHLFKDCAFSADFGILRRNVEEEYCRSGVFFLTEDYLLQTEETLHVFPRIIEDLVREAKIISEDKNAALYALFVCRAMEHRELFRKHLRNFTFPGECRFLPLLCMVPAMHSIRAALRQRNVPEDIIEATLGQFEACTFIYKKRYDRTGLNKRYFDFLQGYVDGRILNINSLRFELINLEDSVVLLENMHTGENLALMYGCEISEATETRGLLRGTPPADAGEKYFRPELAETAEYYEGYPVSPGGRCLSKAEKFQKDTWKAVLRQGDTCLSVHIPDEGDFSKQACDESYERALNVFAKCFTEYRITGFHCHSWMLAPELRSILNEDSRILSFRSRYIPYPAPADGEDVLNFVFNLKFTTYSDLPEDTSLQRALKQKYLTGERLYEYSGLFHIVK